LAGDRLSKAAAISSGNSSVTVFIHQRYEL
jgi:hypothetical protein